MVSTKRKAVVSAEAAHLDEVEGLIRDGRYRSVSEFVREAMGEKLARARQARLAEQVASYCACGHGDADNELIDAQSFDEPEGSRRGRRKRAKG